MTKFSASALLLSFVLFAACKKSSSSSSQSGATITATVDGTAMTFNNILIAQDTTFSGAYLITIGGTSTLTANAPELIITVGGDSAVTTGTYTESSTFMTNDLPGMGYKQGTSLVYSDDLSGINSCTVTVTSRSKTNIQGTFSGTLLLQVGNGASTKAITDGKFNVNFK